MILIQNRSQAVAINALYRELIAFVARNKQDYALLSQWKERASNQWPDLKGIAALEMWLEDYKTQPRWTPWYKPWRWHWFDGIPCRKLEELMAAERMLESLKNWETKGRSSVTPLLRVLESNNRKVSYFSWTGIRLKWRTWSVMNIFNWHKEKVRRTAMGNEEEWVNPEELKKKLKGIYEGTLRALEKYGKKKKGAETHAEIAASYGLADKQKCLELKESVERAVSDKGRYGWLGRKNKDEKLIQLRKHIYYRLLEELLKGDRKEDDWKMIRHLVIEGRKFGEKDDSDVWQAIKNLWCELIKLSDSVLKRESERMSEEDWDKELLYMLGVGKELWGMDKWYFKLLKSDMQKPLIPEVPMDWRVDLEKDLSVKVKGIDECRKEIQKLKEDDKTMIEEKLSVLEENLTNYSIVKDQKSAMFCKENIASLFEAVKKDIQELRTARAYSTKKSTGLEGKSVENDELIKVTPQVKDLCKSLGLEVSGRECVGMKEIKSAYKQKALKLHPDKQEGRKNINRGDVTTQFTIMSTAYKQLVRVKENQASLLRNDDSVVETNEAMKRWYEEFQKLKEYGRRQDERMEKFIHDSDNQINDMKNQLDKTMEEATKGLDENAKEIAGLKAMVADLAKQVNSKHKENGEEEKSSKTSEADMTTPRFFN